MRSNSIILLILFFLCGFGITNAQHLRAINQSPVLDVENEMTQLLVEGNPGQIRTLVNQLGGKFLYARGEFSRIVLPADKIERFRGQNGVRRVQNGIGKLVPLSDVMLINNRIDSVHMGAAPLPQAYTGKDVVVGIIDLGIDYTHEDFKDEFGNTRIKAIWDQTLPTDATAPLPYGYGQECDSASIESAACSHADPYYFYSHGSGVAGVAAGDGSSTGRYTGVAPESDIVIVNLDFGANFLGAVVDAIDYIFNIADAAGKPCVINTSVGTYWGSHDGNDITTQMIENLLDAQPGRVVVAAAGNAGNIPFHLGYEATADTAFTWFEFQPSLGAVYTQFWGDTADLAEFYFSFGADNPSNWEHKGNTPWWNLREDFSLDGGGWDNNTFTLMDGSNRIGVVEAWAVIDDDRYLFEMVVFPDSTDFLWRFNTTGSGRIDSWSDPSYTGTSYIPTYSDLPDPGSFPEIVNYVRPDSQMTMVSSWQNSDKVITVASYYNRDTMTNYYGAMPPVSGTKGDRINSSSNGPTRDWRIKPDISASGQWVLATASSALTSWLIGASAATYVAEGGQHYLQGGTSFSSPIVAGIVALYLERYPDADWNAVKDAVLQSAWSDSYTGTDLPNQYWGYGKIDAFKTLQVPFDECAVPTGVTVTHVIDTGARVVWNEVPNAVGYQLLGHRTGMPNWSARYSEGLVELVPGLSPGTDYEFKMRALCGVVDTSGWTAVYPFTTTTLRESTTTVSWFDILPNPVPGEAIIHYNLGDGTDGFLEIYNLVGSKADVIQLQNGTGSLRWSTDDLSPGIYLYQLKADGSNNVLRTGKLVISR